MIEVKMIGKPKGSTKSAVAGRSASYSVQTVADTARKAYRAESADYADYAEKAGVAARATFADQAMVLADGSPIKDMFLSSQEDDTAQGVITFAKGLIAKLKSTFVNMDAVNGSISYLSGRDLDYQSGVFGGIAAETLDLERELTSPAANITNLTAKTVKADDTVTEKLQATVATVGTLIADSVAADVVSAESVTTKRLEVTGAAHFFQLVIDEVRSVGGRVVLSMASCEARRIVEYTGFYRVYFVAEDDGKSVTNEWAVGDLAICQSFNAGIGTHENVSNKYYWRKVVSGSWAATEYAWDGERKYYYIDLSRVDGEYDESAGGSGLSGDYGVPGVGDVIVQLGNWSDAERASAIVLSAYDDGWLDTEIEAPSIAQYVGVGMDAADRWNLAKCRYTWLARNGNQITGNLRVVTAEGTKEVTEYVSSEVATQTEAIVDTKVTEKTAELVQTVDGLSSTVSKHETSLQEVRGSVVTVEKLVVNNATQIRQNADSISAQATSLETVQQNISDIETQFDNLSDAVDSQQATIDGLPLKTDVELAEYKGEILVESKRIALEVSEITDVRRNMLMGTQFWKNIGYDADGYMVNGSGATLIRRTSDRVNGHNSLEISSSSTSNTYGGIYFLNVPVEAGKSYTISVWTKRMSSSLGNGTSMIVHYKANSEQGTPTWQESQRLVTTADTIGEWVLVRKTITPKAGDYFVNVIFCVVSSGTIRIAEPMMEESEEYTAWSPSASDYAYVMGNMIPGSDTLATVSDGEGLTIAKGRVADGDEAGVYKVSGSTTSTLTLLGIRKSFSQGYSYVLSFWARRTSAASDYAWLCVNFGSNVLVAEYSNGVSPYSADQGRTPYSGYMKLRNVPRTWTRYWVHVIADSNVTLTPLIYIEVTDGRAASFEVKKPKIEYGAVVTEWTASMDDLAEEETVANQLHRTGINITQGTIRLSAKNTIIDGDLHLRGVLVENYADTERGSLVVCDMVRNKSVSVSQAHVVLPMISPQTITSSRADGEVTVAAVREAGVKVTIAAKYEAYVAKWSMATAELYAGNKNAMGYFHSYCTKVFADPRIASCSNYTATDVARIQPEGNGGHLVSGYEGGVFICNGRRGRVLLLMPGQTLHLTSAIETINGSDHLLWYVDNGSEFMPIQKTVSFVGDNWYTRQFYSNGGNALNLYLTADIKRHATASTTQTSSEECSRQEQCSEHTSPSAGGSTTTATPTGCRTWSTSSETPQAESRS